MKKIIAFCSLLLVLCAGATNITNYPVRTTFNANYWFLLSDVPMQTNWNLPGNYVASTTDLNSASNTLWQLSTNLVATNIYYTNLYVTNLFVLTNVANIAYITNLYSSNIWVISLTVTNPITNLNLTANTIVEADANKALASVPNGNGLLTNNGTGTFGWLPLSAVTNINYTFTNLYATNAYFTNLYAQTIVASNAYFQNLWSSNAYFTNLWASNAYFVNLWSSNAYFTNLWASNAYFANVFATNGYFTNLFASNAYISKLYATNILTDQIDYYTNLCTMAPDFAHGYCAITTNASFTFLLPLNVDATKTKVQTTVMRVDNSSASPIVATPPANVFVISNSFMGVGANGRTWFTFVSYPPDVTNVYSSAETH